jgi:hypothetical protein
MLTISEIILNKIKSSPFLEQMISEGLLNISAFSRKIKPEIEKILMHPVSDSAVIMASKRLADKIGKSVSEFHQASKNINDITVKLNISEFTYKNSATLFDRESELLLKNRGNNSSFLTFTHGIYESTILISSNLKNLLHTIFRDEILISSIKNLGAIILQLPDNSYDYPGIYFDILKQLAWENINIIEVVSTLNEFSIILNQNNIDRAFSILKSHLWD